MSSDRTTAQTLSRGLRILEILAENNQPMTALELAAELEVSRPIVYRLLKTLELHNLLDNSLTDGHYGVGLGLLTLARTLVRDLREAAIPEVNALAATHNATAFIGAKDGEELVCLVSAEPAQQVLAIRHREGARLPLTGASSIAMQSGYEPSKTDNADVTAARERGYAISEGHMFPSAFGIAAPVINDNKPSDVSLALIYPKKPDVNEINRASKDVVSAAQRISDHLTM